MKYLGIDYGEKFIGLALADTDTKVSLPLEIIRNHDMAESIEKLLFLINDYKIDKIIIGKPHWHNEKQIKIIDGFAKDLEKQTKVTIDFVDESLTSKMVNTLPGMENFRDRVDDLSAMIILQAYLDSQN